MTRSGRRIILISMLWIAVIAAAALADRPIAQWVNRAQPYDKHDWLVQAVKVFGTFPVALILGAIMAGVRRSWRILVPFVVSGPLVGLAYLLLKWLVGRQRPVLGISPFDFHPLANGLGGLVHAEKGLSFPSGHAAMAFAAATCLAWAAPRGFFVWFLVATAVGAERVLENAHYLSDVLAGAGIGVLCGIAAVRITARMFGRPPPCQLSPIDSRPTDVAEDAPVRADLPLDSVRQ